MCACQFTPDLHWGDLVRLFGIRFSAGSEDVSIDMSDQTVDFTDFRGLTINDMQLTRCRVSDIRLLLSQYHPYVTFENCDLSRVPADQLKFPGTISDWQKIFTVGNFHLRDGVPQNCIRELELSATTRFSVTTKA